MPPTIRRRIIPIATTKPATTAPAAVAPKPGPVRRNLGGGGVVAIKAKLAEVIQISDEPTPGTAGEIIDRYRKRVRSPLTAIRAHCIGCSNGYRKEVEECRVVKCALHPFRMGKNPFHGKAIAAAQARAAAEDGEPEVDDGSNEEAGGEDDE